MPYKVVGTTRTPDGDTKGHICELIVEMNGKLEIVPKQQAVHMAERRELWTTDEKGEAVWVVPVHRNEAPDYVRTDPDKTRRNNLLWLKIWAKSAQQWLMPHAA